MGSEATIGVWINRSNNCEPLRGYSLTNHQAIHQDLGTVVIRHITE